MDPTLTTLAVVICARLTSLGMLALRLRARAHHQRRQHCTLLALATHLPPGLLLELDDPHDDSTRMRLQTCVEDYGRGHYDRV